MKSTFLDYIYYRLQKFYKKWDGENGITSVIGVSMLQCLFIMNILLTFIKIFFTRNETKHFSKLFGYGAVGLFLLFTLLNHFKYKDRYKEFEDLWGNESKKTKIIKGFKVIAALSIPWIILLCLANI